jgi:hypothetical protein
MTDEELREAMRRIRVTCPACHKVVRVTARQTYALHRTRDNRQWCELAQTSATQNPEYVASLKTLQQGLAL